jgi:hypothetical protein
MVQQVRARSPLLRLQGGHKADGWRRTRGRPAAGGTQVHLSLPLFNFWYVSRQGFHQFLDGAGTQGRPWHQEEDRGRDGGTEVEAASDLGIALG